MVKGETAFYEDLLVPINRNGGVEDVYWTFSYSPVQDEGGAIAGLLVVCIETTDKIVNLRELATAQQQLQTTLSDVRASEEQFRIFSNNLQNLAWIAYGEGWIFWYNQRWYDYNGTTLEEMEGWGWEKVHHPGHIARIIEFTKTAWLTDKPFELTFPLRGKDGSFRWFLTRAVPVFDENGKCYRWVGTNTDIHEQVLAEEALRESETKLRSVIAGAPAAIALFAGRDMLIELPNEFFINMLGKGPDIAGKPLREVLPELVTEGSPLLDVLDEVYTTGIAYHASDMLVKLFRDGEMHDDYFNFSYTPLRDDTGAVYAILDVAIDVTGTVRARLATEEAELALRGAVELAELGTWSIDVATNGLTYSPRLIEWFGYDPSSQDYSKVIPILSDEDQERVSAAVAAALTPGSDGIYDETYTVIHPRTGHKRVLHAHGKAVKDAAGNVIRMNGTAQDVTMQRRQQEELERQVRERTAELMRSNEDLQQFAHVASHDLKEPVRKIKTFASFIEADKALLSERSRMSLDKVQSATDRMAEMINGVLAYSTLAATEQVAERISLNETISNVETDLEMLILQKDGRIERGSLPEIEGASVLIHQLFYNLVNNAMKFSRVGVPPHIKITSEAGDGDSITISVADNGIGFEPEYAERIFKTFSRLNAKDKFEGTGLGLSLCRKIVERHGGNITAEGIAGEGAKFIITLPLPASGKP